MNIDGNAIATDILKTLRERVACAGKKIFIQVFIVGSNYASNQFVALKKKKAEEIGMSVGVMSFPEDVSEELLAQEIEKSALDKSTDAIIVQLPLPQRMNTQAILSRIPKEKDIDVLSPLSRESFEKGVLDILPPVVLSIREVLRREGIEVADKRALVVGKGLLVGKPIATWLTQNGAEVTVVDRDTVNLPSYTKAAEIIVSGVGEPSIVKPEMIREGVMLFDAGTSEANGKLSGDIAPSCASKASIFTPVPGGIGPITVAKLLENAVEKSL